MASTYGLCVRRKLKKLISILTAVFLISAPTTFGKRYAEEIQRIASPDGYQEGLVYEHKHKGKTKTHVMINMCGLVCGYVFVIFKEKDVKIRVEWKTNYEVNIYYPEGTRHNRKSTNEIYLCKDKQVLAHLIPTKE